MWRAAGLLAFLALVMDVLTLAGFSIVMAGGNAKRETGWRALCVMLVGVAALHFGAVAVVVSFGTSGADVRC